MTSAIQNNAASAAGSPDLTTDVASRDSAPARATHPKVVRIIARLNVGGPARQACLLHEKLAAHADTRLVFGRLADGEQDMSHLLGSQERVLRLPDLSREISLLSDARSFWTILRFLRKERPDIVHTHTAKAGALGRFAAWLARVPVIVHTYHGHVFQSYFSATKSRAYIAVERLLGRLTTKVVAISSSQRDELAGTYKIIPFSKIAVIHNGFEFAVCGPGDREAARRELGIGAGDFVAAWVGRMVRVKDVQFLGQVIRSACVRKSKVIFLVVGDGTERPVLESLVQDCSNVRLLGWRKDVERVWAAADVALLTSRNEGTPTALIEAMAAGVPFVATRVGAVPDLAVGPLRDLPGDMGTEAANGFLAARTPDAFLHCIEKLANDPGLAMAMAAQGRSFTASMFSAQRLVNDMNALYRSLLAEVRD